MVITADKEKVEHQNSRRADHECGRETLAAACELHDLMILVRRHFMKETARDLQRPTANTASNLNCHI